MRVAGPYDPAAPVRVAVWAGAAGVPTFYSPQFDEFVNDVWRMCACRSASCCATKVIAATRCCRLEAIKRCGSLQLVMTRQLVEVDNRAAAAAVRGWR